MIHRIRPIRPNLHLKHRIGARPADPLNGNPHIGQILSQPPVIDSQLDKVSNPIRRKFHAFTRPVILSEGSAPVKRKHSRSRGTLPSPPQKLPLSGNSHDVPVVYG